MRDLDTDLGREIEVHVGDQSKRLRVVGTVVLPRFAPYPQSEPTGLGTGALMHFDDADELYGSLGEGVNGRFYLVDVVDPSQTTAQQLQERLYSGDADFDGEVLGPQRPNDVLSYDRLQNTPLALAALLVLLGVGTLVHLLVTAVRGRRRDIAVLRSAGSTARQIRRTVVVQALTLVGIATVVALPIGIVGGRLLWNTTAHWLGIPAEPRVPVWSLTGTVVVTFVFAVVVALIPARTASRLRPAEILRSE
jgi:ABC-type antimicrobial peptide transport system permease subunit